MSEAQINNLKDLGYEDFFELNRHKLGWDKFPAGRVIAEHKGAYVVISQNGEFFSRVTGKKMFEAVSREDYPAVGDWVAISELEDGQAVIRGILPRKTIIKRKFGDKNRAGEKTEMQVVGANIDVAFVVLSVDRDYNLNRAERYFALAADGRVSPAIILNKIDLISQEELNLKLEEISARFKDIEVIPTSILSGQGLDRLNAYILPGKTYCFLGSSGAGKSSLINKLIGESRIKTGDISLYSGRGKHVTTRRELYLLKNGGMVIDNPGMREVGMTDAINGIDMLFAEITALGNTCKYVDCTHLTEPGCRVLEALRSGNLDEGRYSNYIHLKKESEFFEMSGLEKRQKDRSFGQFVKKAKKEIRRYKP